MIYGGNGNDTIFGSSGDVSRPANWPLTLTSFDPTFAGSGNDMIYGDAGIDFIYGGVGTASIDGGTGNDFIYGGTGSETIHGGTGDDYIKTGDGNEQIFGDTGNDLLVQIVAADQSLSDTTLTGRGSDTFDGIERVQLSDPSAAGGYHDRSWRMDRGRRRSSVPRSGDRTASPPPPMPISRSPTEISPLRSAEASC